ncbi:DUF6228 family protein [Actinokineospora xionganensis]|uniref:Polyketide cyclase / dehydrase and lipid transport n=1 Tax=Actinokineospora xionganensis TaxID=2684470 RepID=A0ABR7L160_9PSEU|nr:DUF6228 family protein [Actinokineospora xionganensis]MBC6446416.1 hypothetical protein [Actinokineospora xionganensis]
MKFADDRAHRFEVQETTANRLAEFRPDARAGMTCVFDPDDPDAVSIGLDTWVRLWNPHDPYGDGHVLAVCVELGAPGMSAALHSLKMARSDLGEFLCATAAETIRAPRRWTSDDADLTVEVEPPSRGHVRVTWTLRPWRGADGAWSACVRLDVEGGAELDQLGGEIHRLLHR